jgi:hypothetical protein
MNFGSDVMSPGRTATAKRKSNDYRRRAAGSSAGF